MAIPAMDYADVDLPESLQHYTTVQFLLRQQDPQPVQQNEYGKAALKICWSLGFYGVTSICDVVLLFSALTG